MTFTEVAKIIIQSHKRNKRQDTSNDLTRKGTTTESHKGRPATVPPETTRGGNMVGKKKHTITMTPNQKKCAKKGTTAVKLLLLVRQVLDDLPLGLEVIAAHMAVGGQLAKLRLLQLEVALDATGTEIKIALDNLAQVLI